MIMAVRWINGVCSFPLMLASNNQIGSLFELPKDLNDKFRFSGYRGFAITGSLPGGEIELTTINFNVVDITDVHGEMDRIVYGAASPYSPSPNHRRSGAFLLQRWYVVHGITVAQLLEATEVASKRAARLVPCHLDICHEVLTHTMVQHRRLEREKLDRLVEYIKSL
jgi:hypothetical protein